MTAPPILAVRLFLCAGRNMDLLLRDQAAIDLAGPILIM